ncbi:MAG: DNA-binding protein [Methylomonas sp.]|nr:MAG: DNA-binding protein [Methylomonas sp.]
MLPPILRAIVKALGFARAQAWLADYGGVPLRFFKHKTQALGLAPDELERMRLVLAPHLGARGEFTCPKADKLFMLIRNSAIIQGKERETIRQQARLYNLSSRQIINIRGSVDKYEQLDLFD